MVKDVHMGRSDEFETGKIASLLPIQEAREAKSGLTHAANHSSVTPLLDVLHHGAKPACGKKKVQTKSKMNNLSVLPFRSVRA